MGMNLSRLDPRGWATAFPRATVAFFAAVTCVMAYGNLIAERGSVLDDPILDKSNPFLQSDVYVRGRRADGFHADESVLFLLRFPQGIRSTEELQRVREFTERVKAEFGPALLSLSNVSDYQDTGDALLTARYIPEEFGPEFNMREWKDRVVANSMVFGTMIGRDFQSAAVVRYLPAKHDPIGEYRRTVEFLEGRRIPWWEWLYKTDIVLPQNTGAAGPFVLQGLFDQALRIDNAVLVGAGLAVAFPLFVWFLGSVRQATVGVLGVVALGYLWTRGSVGLVQLLGFDFKERLFTLLAYTNCIVQGVSCVLHKFEAYNEVLGSPECPADPRERWNRARGNDHLIAATAVIAIFGFSTLYSFQVRSIREVWVFSALGVVWLLGLVTVLVPALHIVTSGHRSPRGNPRPSATGVAVRKGLDAIAEACTSLVTRAREGSAAKVAAMGTLGLVVLAVVMIWPTNLLLVKQETSKLLKGTALESTVNFLDAPGRMGRGAAEFLVEPSGGGDIYSPAFLDSVARYQARLHREPGFREVVSAIGMVQRVSEESLHKPLPETRREARAVFNLIESELKPVVARQLYYPAGMRMTVHFVNEDTVVSRDTFEIALKIAAKDFPGLHASPFGRESQYPQLDDYVRLGKPINVLSSQWVVIAFCWFILSLNNRRVWARRRNGPKLSASLGGFLMSVPFLFASAVIVIVMVLFEIPLDMGTASIAALAINASVDFSIYYTDAYQRGLAKCGTHLAAVRYAMHDKGRIVLEDALLNSICFLPLMLSRFEPIRDVGWIMAVMLAACAFGTVVIMPALFRLGLQRAEGHGDR
jgi:predicted RND superfamily exporter protein